MLAKKFALGFGIAIILPMMIHYGVSTFSPSPKWEDYHNRVDYNQKIQNASDEEKEVLRRERKDLAEEYKLHNKRFQQHLFIVAVPIGIIAIIIGSMSSVQAIGTGLMFGGIFTLLDGYLVYWSELQDWMRFLSLLVAFVVLIFIGYRKLAK